MTPRPGGPPAIPSGPPAELPIWKGRRGVLNTAACCVLSLPCAFALFSLAARSTVVPVCTAYAGAHEMAYADFKLVGVKHASTVVCLLIQANGKHQDIYLRELVPVRHQSPGRLRDEP